MAIFPNLELEELVQVGDKTRLDSTRSYVAKGEAAITLIEIEPEGSAGFIDVTGTSSRDWFLDWEYAGATRTVTVSTRVTTDGAPVTSTKTIEVVTASDDNLFSADHDLTAVEPDILKYVREGRNSYLDVHRKAQTLILDWLDDKGVRLTDGSKIEKQHIVDTEEVRKWSENVVLKLVFEGCSNAVDDIFSLKAQKYAAMEAEARKRAVVKFDADGDSSIETGEFVNFTTGDLVRR